MAKAFKMIRKFARSKEEYKIFKKYWKRLPVAEKQKLAGKFKVAFQKFLEL